MCSPRAQVETAKQYGIWRLTDYAVPFANYWFCAITALAKHLRTAKPSHWEYNASTTFKLRTCSSVKRMIESISNIGLGSEWFEAMEAEGTSSFEMLILIWLQLELLNETSICTSSKG